VRSDDERREQQRENRMPFSLFIFPPFCLKRATHCAAASDNSKQANAALFINTINEMNLLFTSILLNR